MNITLAFDACNQDHQAQYHNDGQNGVANILPLKKGEIMLVNYFAKI